MILEKFCKIVLTHIAIHDALYRKTPPFAPQTALPFKAPTGAFKRQNGLAPARWRGLAPTSSAHDAQNADNARKNTAFPLVCKSVRKCAEPQKKENPTMNLTILRVILVRSRELESLALWLKEPLGLGTLILKLSSLRYFCAKHRDFSLCNFCTLCRILQVRVPIASLETVQKQCRNRALTLGQMKNDDFWSMTWWRFEWP